MRTVFAVIAFAFTSVAVVAQPAAPLAPLAPPASPPPPAPLAPGQVGPTGTESPFLNPGTEVSRPLTPVGPAPGEGPPPPKPEEPKRDEPKPEPKLDPVPRPDPGPCLPVPQGPLGSGWSSAEALFWWPLRQPVPPLVAGTRTGDTPAPGDRAALLIGGRSLNTQPQAGGRFTLGSALDNAETYGYEVTYLFLGTRTARGVVSDFPGSRLRAFGLTYNDASTGAPAYFPLAQPGVSSSVLGVSTSTRVQGWEVNGVTNVIDDKNFRLNALAGWRYFQVQEGLRVEQTQYRFADSPGVYRTADQFDGHNRFNGGQLGLHADARRGALFCEMTAKVAFGQNYEVVKDEGMTVIQTAGAGGVATRAYGGSGILVQPSNFGRTAGGVFAVVPEGTVKFGFRFGEAGRVYFGYSFIYLSDAVRPGDQIDRTLNASQLALMNGTGPALNADRPAHIVNRSDFWAQGLMFGLETRY